MSRTGGEEGEGVGVLDTDVVVVVEEVGVAVDDKDELGVIDGVADGVGVAVLPLDMDGVGVDVGVSVGVRDGVAAATMEKAGLLKVVVSTVITAVYLVPPDPGTKAAGHV
jgi:hypothetical protein